MSGREFNRNLIRLPLDYEGTPELAEIRVSLPSHIVWDGGAGALAIGLELLDKWGFHIPGRRASLQLTLEGGPGEIPERVEVLPEHDSHLKVGGRVTEKGKVFRVRARDLETGVEAISNPAWLPERLGAADHKLYWGDLHAHRIEVPRTKSEDPLLWSYGPATPHEFYQFARDVVHLDFAALTDHDYAITTEEYRLIQESAQYYNQADRFVAFLGYEWAWNFGPDADHGHRHILFLHDDMPLICSNWRGSNTPQDLFNIFRRISRNGADILSIPHHPARLGDRIWYNWESADPHFERLLEVYSAWGSSEHQGEPYPLRARPAVWGTGGKIAEGEVFPPYEAVGHFLQDGLRMGRRLGCTGGSESHDGRAGFPVMIASYPLKQVPFLYRGGLTGIWARRKIRDCLWSSLWNRRTIASTGARILLDLAIDDQPLGETIRVTEPPRTLQVRVHGTAPLERVAVVKNNEDWRVLERPGWDCTFTADGLDLPVGGVDWYYVRVIQEDGHMAWSSPIWIEDGR